MVKASSRRDLLVRAAAMAGAALSPTLWTPSPARARTPDDPFTLGVASGEPTPDGMVLWTRLAPRPLDPDGGLGPEPIIVAWEVFEDEALRRPALAGRTLAVAEAAHAVHVEVAGLSPGREYWYRFHAAGHASAVGRTRTAPPADEATPGVRFAFGACQKYEAGFYHAHRQLAADAPDLVLFLGDYVYEQAATDRGVRRHPEFEACDLAGYRLRYAVYKSDPNLQAAHAVAPWMVIWDDHEVENDYSGDHGREEADPEAFLARRAAAYQAYYEHMPLRRRSRPVGPQMLLHRTLDWGRLAQFQFLDTRQHRTPAPPSMSKRLIQDCADRRDPTRSMLGASQEGWLLETLSNSQARWNLLAQQYLMAEMCVPGGWYSSDAWDGFPVCRQRIVERWRDARVSNPVALGGDIHTFVAGQIGPRRGAPPIATEFVGGSLTSKGRDSSLVRMVKNANPHLKFADSAFRGYGLVDLTEKAATVTFRAVNNVKAPDSAVHDLARFVVEDGRAGVVNA